MMKMNGKVEVESRGYDAAWETAARTIAAKNFQGLRVSCPRCNKNGTLISKWIKGTPIKPLYVCHTNGNGFFKACNLNKEQAFFVRSKISINRSDIMKTLRMGKAFALFSGGKDSLCLLHYLSRLAKRIQKEITALHVDTTVGFPEVEDYVQNICHQINVPLITVRPPHDYYDLAKRWGIPGVKSRWCCETLKIAPIRRFFSNLKGPKVVFDGIRAAESNLRATYVPIWYHPSFRCISVSPVFGWSDEKVDKYIEENNLPKGPASELNTSAECWCGAYKCRSDFEALLKIHPEIFKKLVEVEKAQKGKYTFLFENGVRIPLNSLRKRDNLFNTQREGNLLYYALNMEHPLYKELKAIVAKTVGIEGSLRNALSSVEGIQIAFIYGSFAARREKGTSDIDLLIIGNPDTSQLNEKIATLEKRLKREINPTIYAFVEYKAKKKAKSGFIMDLLKNPKIMVIGKQDDL